ncbi:MAG TPA: glycosyltransferase [Tepidisphaeraceae bacterium]|jgi:glycosyltransferase involved in cell wall biosynthesis
MLSIIVPAHNEEAALPATLDALTRAAASHGEEYEIVVVDDDSTDRTAAVALQHGARVHPVKLRQISAVRNAGAQAAQGEYLVFVDADTIVPETTLAEALAALKGGAVGGGAPVKFDARTPLWATPAVWILSLGWFRVIRWAAGCFVFARRDTFNEIGGFDENYFFGEEMYISIALKRHGRFTIVRTPVITSARKFRSYGLLQSVMSLARLLRKGPRATREHAPWWYEARREPPPQNPQR